MLCEQKKERAFLSLNRLGGFLDCSFCEIQSITPAHSYNSTNVYATVEEGTIFEVQTSEQCSEYRKLFRSVSFQTFYAASQIFDATKTWLFKKIGL